jgi:4-aminobutyrate aminotransferase-like enzyme
MRLWETNARNGVTLVCGDGCTVWDDTGKPYLDLLAGTWCNVLGYAHPRWTAAVADQGTGLVHVGSGFATLEVDAALAKLAEILPPELCRAVLLNTGSEAVELALKMARAATGREAVVVVEKSYYGATNHALSLSEEGRTASYLPHPGAIHRLPAPTCRRCPAGCSWPCDGLPCADPSRLPAGTGEGAIAAVIHEPVLAGAGITVPPSGYGRALRELAKRYGGLLISEEITTGMGRTGRWFGFEHDEVVPDILVIGKAIGGGLPVSAVVTTEAVEAGCRGELRHVQSHQNDPFSGRIAATVISILQDEGLVAQASARGAHLLDQLLRLQRGCSGIADVRGSGLMIGIELDGGYSGSGLGVHRRLLNAGFITDYQPATGTLRLFPPYVISTRELDQFVACLRDCLRSA